MKEKTKIAVPKVGKGISLSKERVDQLLIHGRTEDGQGLKVLRRRDDIVEAGVAHPLREGQSIQGEVVRLKPHPDFPLLCDVEVELADPKSMRKGPSKASTPRFRANWNTIWGKSKKTPSPLN
ncbi:MAG: hypothetical protein IPJ88_11110 [Myxococcales bacterium]|nr:MAG: hypothetical protein IPJ88_11110 [Myxococcales bacterium]